MRLERQADDPQPEVQLPPAEAHLGEIPNQEGKGTQSLGRSAFRGMPCPEKKGEWKRSGSVSEVLGMVRAPESGGL